MLEITISAFGYISVMPLTHSTHAKYIALTGFLLTGSKSHVPMNYYCWDLFGRNRGLSDQIIDIENSCATDSLSIYHKRRIKEESPAVWVANQQHIFAISAISIMLTAAIAMMTSSNGNIFRVTGHLFKEFTGPRWIPRTKASDAELWCFLWSASE